MWIFNEKSKHIIGTAKITLEKHNSRVPSTFAELETLPGVGHKIASVIMDQCFDKPAFPVDTHIARLANH
jgi:endonuclease-3